MNILLAVVLFLTPCVATDEQDSDVLTIGLNVGAEGPPSNAWMRTTIEFSNGTEEVTMCLNVKIMVIDGECSTIMCLATRPRIFLTVTSDNRILLAFGDEFYSFNVQIIPRKWKHICVSISSTFSVFVDANPVVEDSSLMEMSGLFKGSVQVFVGVPTAYASTCKGVIGYLTMPQVFSRVLKDEIQDLAAGGEVQGNLLAESEWKVYCHGSLLVTTVSFNDTPISADPFNNSCFDVQWEDSSEVFLPRPLYDYVFLNKLLTYSQAEHICSNLGGDIPSLDDISVLAKMDKESQSRKNTLDGFQTWLKRSNETSCLIYVASRKSHRQCKQRVTQQFCKIPLNTAFTLRGFFFSELKFYLSKDVQSFKFVCIEGLEIEIDSSRPEAIFLYINKYPKERIGHVPVTDFSFTGRRKWLFPKRVDSIFYLISLTRCSNNEFTCNDGTCLALSKRCDGEIDCSDGSDEGCQTLLPLPRTYNPSRPHERRTPVGLDLEIFDILNVDVTNNIINLHLKIKTSWKDERITLLHLRDTTVFNVIQNESIWSPTYFFPSANFEDNMAIKNKKNVDYSIMSQKEREGKVKCRNTFEGYEYSGSDDSFFILEMEFVASFRCQYLLNLYPFDQHVCSVPVEIFRKGEFIPYLNKSDIRVRGGNFSLALFETKPPLYDTINDAREYTSGITVKIFLKRSFGAYCFTTLLPCFMLEIIGTFTQFFDPGNFSDRIMVTLSCLIVAAALFSQVAVTAPESAIPKAIDIYFFYCIMRLLYVFIHHCLLEWVRFYVQKRTEEEANKDKERKLFNKIETEDFPGTGIQESKKLFLQGSFHSNDFTRGCPSPAWYLNQRRDTKKVKGSTAAPKKYYLSLYKIFNVIGIIFIFVCDIVASFFYGSYIIDMNDSVLMEYLGNFSDSQ